MALTSSMIISPISVLVLLLTVVVFASATTGESTYGYDPNHIPADKSAETKEQEKLLSTTLGIQGIIYCRSGSKLTPLEGAVARITCLANDEHGYERAPFSILSDASDDKGYFFATLSPDEVQQNWRLKECRAFLEVSPSETCNVPTGMNHESVVLFLRYIAPSLRRISNCSLLAHFVSPPTPIQPLMEEKISQQNDYSSNGGQSNKEERKKITYKNRGHRIRAHDSEAYQREPYFAPAFTGSELEIVWQIGTELDGKMPSIKPTG
ncbi:hypothetical protein Ddye_017034 [Dipteronia dyeriana]|uniref:Pollen Ole e 1 allergen and extensin family protein n=1 Tax=Dipteronia dyeriana TaxID=168575 RepID=A0AAD9X141_9ROSI|nr:hypothetical protein Ddye_017034 [Dipteronia dyeriana]